MSRHGGTALGGNTWRSSTTGVAATGLVSAPSCGLSVATTGAESAGSEATTEMLATELDSLELPEVDELEELVVGGSSTFKDYCDEERLRSLIGSHSAELGFWTCRTGGYTYAPFWAGFRSGSVLLEASKTQLV